jgi:hypothetical protein
VLLLNHYLDTCLHECMLPLWPPPPLAVMSYNHEVKKRQERRVSIGLVYSDSSGAVGQRIKYATITREGDGGDGGGGGGERERERERER